MTSLLRKEYNQKQFEKEKQLTQNAYSWLQENIIFLNEQIDRRTVQRLTNAITKFDETFGPFKEKLPSLNAQINQAEKDLENIITGKTNEERASGALQKFSFLYSFFSKFFNKDLPVLLNSHLFLVPKDNPDIRLDSLNSPPDKRYSPLLIKSAFVNALTPSKDEQRLLNKIYRSRVPAVNATEIADQMLMLSLNELKELTAVGKVPMVATPEQPPAAEQPQQAPAVAAESVDHKKKVVNEQRKWLIEEKTYLLTEKFDIEKLKLLDRQFKSLKQVFAKYGNQMPETKHVLDVINQQINKIMSSAGAGAMDKVAKLFGRGVEADIMNTYKTLKSFDDVWDATKDRFGGAPTNVPITQLVNQKNLNPEQITQLQQTTNQVKTMLTQALGKPFFSFKKQVLSPQKFVEEMFKLSIDDIDNVVKGVNFPNPTEVDPNAGQNQENIPGTKVPNKTETPETLAKTLVPGETVTPKKSKGTEPGKPVNISQLTPQQLDTLAMEIGGEVGIPDDDPKIKGLRTALDLISKAGFNLTQ